MRRRLTDRFVDAVRGCGSDDELRTVLEDMTRDLGFRYFALLHHLAPRDSAHHGYVRLDNYPAAWVREWLERGFDQADPVHAASRRSPGGFAWSKLACTVRLSKVQRLILKRSRTFGIGAGFTVPVSLPGEPAATFSFAVETGNDLPGQRLACAEQLAVHAFAAARRLRRRSSEANRPRLSPRQIQCLRLLAAGKSDWEIALILGIAHETARQYVKSARAAYDAVSRTQLAFLALQDELISFEELQLPRRG